MRRLVLAPALALALLAPHVEAAPAAPQITDPSGDANLTGNAVYDTATPVGNQDYADVVSVLWQSTKATKKVKGKNVTSVTGFTVTATLAGAPTPPAPTQLVYRMLASTPNCGFIGVVYYTEKSRDETIPVSGLRDNCGGIPTRLTPIAMPKITGNTITWTVPLSAIPKDTKVNAGSKLVDLWFEVRQLQDYQTCTDASTPEVGRTCGAANGVMDNSQKMGTFTIG